MSDNSLTVKYAEPDRIRWQHFVNLCADIGLQILAGEQAREAENAAAIELPVPLCNECSHL